MEKIMKYASTVLIIIFILCGAIVTFDNNGVGTFTFTNIRSNVLQKATIQLAGNKVLLTTKIVASGEYESETYFGDNVTTNLKYHRDR
ncbi:hypothetical protein [Bacillus pseudomycoides]|uniref:hypothetical protein n=2 Tax=Bacillaceae TaxID=186817 RepID=UPI0004977BA9|nr:hypothetical protein [Bacillus pseudomycoides]